MMTSAVVAKGRPRQAEPSARVRSPHCGDAAHPAPPGPWPGLELRGVGCRVRRALASRRPGSSSIPVDCPSDERARPRPARQPQQRSKIPPFLDVLKNLMRINRVNRSGPHAMASVLGPHPLPRILAGSRASPTRVQDGWPTSTAQLAQTVLSRDRVLDRVPARLSLRLIERLNNTNTSARFQTICFLLKTFQFNSLKRKKKKEKKRNLC